MGSNDDTGPAVGTLPQPPQSLPDEDTGCLSLLARRRRGCGMECRPLRMDEIRRWRMSGGALRHHTGGFFSVVGIRGTLQAVANTAGPTVVEQPIIHQPEIGILGILARRHGERVEILVQAKAEPGNVNAVQLSPTVQATESNYSRLHGGEPTAFLEHFLSSGCWTVLSDSRQSEQGTRFLGKYNRNATVLVDGRGPGAVPEAWGWCDAASLLRALGRDYCVNTDLRSVLATSDWSLLAGGGVPFGRWRGLGGFGEALLESFLAGEAAAESPMSLLRGNLERVRNGIRLEVAFRPLDGLAGWTSDREGIRENTGTRFEVRGFRVHAPDREVIDWEQPLLCDLGLGEVALIAQRRRGVLHFLLRPSVEVGFREKAQYGPSFQRHPERHPAGNPVLAASVDDPLGDLLAERQSLEHRSCLLSEEGGRFFRTSSRYRVAEVPERIPVPEIPGCCWATLGQIHRLLKTPGFFTNEARSAVALLLGWLTGP